MINYFNTLNFREKLLQLKKCRLIDNNELKKTNHYLKNKKIVIIGCGSQGLNQGLNMRDSGLDISYALRKKSINSKNSSWKKAINNKFTVGTYEELIPKADLVINLTPDKQHSSVIKLIQNLMKKNSYLGYSHGFNIVEEGEKIRKDITVIMVAPKAPGTEVRKEYLKNFGVPTLIAVHPENNPKSTGIEIAKEWAMAIGGHRAGILESSFIAEVKSDLMGEQTILCGMLQTASLVYYEKMISEKIDPNFSGELLQFGWEKITQSLKEGGITLMMDRLSNQDKIRSYKLSKKLKKILTKLFHKHMDDIISGKFSSEMIQDWKNHDIQLLKWREKTKNSEFEKQTKFIQTLSEQDYFENGVFLVSIIKAGVELAFETMINTGMSSKSAYYESLHELPLIASTISKKRLYGMNIVISDTAEYGNYLFYSSAAPILKKFIEKLKIKELLKNNSANIKIDNVKLKNMNESIQNHPIEIIGKKLRSYMSKS